MPFRDYVDRTGNHVLSMARLARDVLAEIPDQLVSYMKSQGIRPRPPPAAPEPSPPPAVACSLWPGTGGLRHGLGAGQ